MPDVNLNDSKMKKHEKFLTLSNLNPAVKNLQYAVRGYIAIRAAQIEKELEQVCSWKVFYLIRLTDQNSF